MDRKTEIQERIKAIAAEMAALLDENEELTEDQEGQYTTLETEAGELETELAAIVAAETRQERQERAAALAKSAAQGHRITAPSRPNSGGRIGRIKDNIADDPQRGFKTLAEFAVRVQEFGANPRADDGLMRVAAGTGLSSSINADGGVLVPPAFSKSIWDRVLAKSNSLLSFCMNIPIDPGVESITFPAIAESSRADGSRWGGVRGYWKGELTQLTSSQLKFRDVTFKPNELYVFCYVSDKLLRQAPGTASSVMEMAAADEIDFKIGDAIINGDGAGKPTGIVGHAGTVSITKETGQAAATIVKENVDKMYARCHRNWRDGAVWLVNQDVEPALEQLSAVVGTGGVPVFLPPGGVTEAPNARLKGKPVIPVEYCATLGTVGDIILCNLMAYGAAVRGMVDSAYSMHLKFDYAQTAYRLIFELDGQPWLNTAITPFKGSNTTSPIVTLATRA